MTKEDERLALVVEYFNKTPTDYVTEDMGLINGQFYKQIWETDFTKADVANMRGHGIPLVAPHEFHIVARVMPDDYIVLDDDGKVNFSQSVDNWLFEGSTESFFDFLLFGEINWGATEEESEANTYYCPTIRDRFAFLNDPENVLDQMKLLR
jgi:hypothetical protein